jgi:hypothetical protein
MPKQPEALPALPRHARLIVPVLGAVGGCGRSTVAGLLAGVFGEAGESVVLDTAPRLASPWSSWTSRSGGGLASVPSHQPATTSQVRSAAAPMTSASTAAQPAAVLTDQQQWSAPPLHLPQDPAAWYQLAAIGGWQAVIADTQHPAGQDLLASRSAGSASITSGWYRLPCSVPVLTAAATGPGVHALQLLMHAALAEGLPLQHTVVALVATGPGRMPSAVRAALTMLTSQVAAAITVPYEAHIRAHGMSSPLPARADARTAAGQLARAVLSVAHRLAGEPLPLAPVPAPLSPSSAPVIGVAR